MGLIKEFKEFAMKGNVMDMAVGIIIGAAFGKIVASLVGDVIMPLIGAVTGGGSLGDKLLYLGSLREDEQLPITLERAKELGGAYINWGPFVQTTIDFIIIAFAIFMMIKLINRARALVEGEVGELAPTKKKCEFCQTEISIKATRCPNCTSELSAN